MKKVLVVIVSFILLSVLCGCGLQQSFYRTDEGLYSYNDQLYQNNGEITLSEKEQEYAELKETFPEGVEGAEWYTELYEYENWLLLGIDDSRSLSGMDGHRYFLLIPAGEGSPGNYQIPAGADGMPSAIYYDGALYQYESGAVSGEELNGMEKVGLIQSVNENWPTEELQTTSPGLLGHLLFEYEGKLLVSGDGETYERYGLKEYLGKMN